MAESDIRRLLRRWDIRPSKGLGQNFLTDPRTADKIVAAAGLTPSDTALEVGAGTGVLTRRLAAAAARVVAVELDHRLVPLLRSELGDCSNLTLVEGDILSLDPAALVGEGEYRVVANLPYYITAAVLRHLLGARRRPVRLVLTVQREVAQRLVARPGAMSLLAVSVQFYGTPRLLFRIPPGSFYPAPGVESAVVRIDTHPVLPLPPEQIPHFFRVVRAGFSQRRKQLRNTLSAGLHLPPEEVARCLREAGIAPRRRAQSLSVAEWVRLVSGLKF